MIWKRNNRNEEDDNNSDNNNDNDVENNDKDINDNNNHKNKWSLQHMAIVTNTSQAKQRHLRLHCCLNLEHSRKLELQT